MKLIVTCMAIRGVASTGKALGPHSRISSPRQEPVRNYSNSYSGQSVFLTLHILRERSNQLAITVIVQYSKYFALRNT